VRRHLVPSLAVFAVAVAVRLWLRSGLILGDDAQEFGVLQHVLANGPDLRDQLQVRFGGWVVNYVACLLLGVSETTVLLPSMLLSSSFSLLGYVLLVHWGYDRLRAFLGGILVATAPFEVVLGTCRTNDLVLAGAFARSGARPPGAAPVVAGIRRAGALVRLLRGFRLRSRRSALRARGPALASELRVRPDERRPARRDRPLLESRLGTYVPFMDMHAANYPVAAKDLTLEAATCA
jgi:hypothetical protein